ncbi:MAG: glycosyltransferase, partial [Gammaproteobacteria bacterium]|nr:glycosyltransferase [Gammaproteobacteria bacterium]
PDTVIVDGIKVHRVPHSFEIASCDFAFKGHVIYKKLVQWADIINYHFPWPFADILYFLYGQNKTSIITYHSDIIRQKSLLKLYNPLMYYFLSKATKIVATSPQYAESSKVLQRYKNKVSIIPIGISEKKTVSSEINNNKWSKKFDKPFFLFVGVLRYYKGLHVLIDAAKEVDYPIVIAGKGPEEQSLKSQARELGLNNIHFLGYISDEDKVSLLQRCLAIVFPSYLRSEAFGVTLLEGAMCSKPMISVDIGSGMNYVNPHLKTGLQVKANDPQAFAKAMTKLYQQPEYAKQLGNAARKRYETHFTGEIMGQKYDQLYQELI